MQFHKDAIGGYLGAKYRSKSGFPVINLPGCPCHSDVLAGTLSALANDLPLELNETNSPLDWYRIMVHQGCTRNEYHEYRVEEKTVWRERLPFLLHGMPRTACQGTL